DVTGGPVPVPSSAAIPPFQPAPARLACGLSTNEPWTLRFHFRSNNTPFTYTARGVPVPAAGQSTTPFTPVRVMMGNVPLLIHGFVSTNSVLAVFESGEPTYYFHFKQAMSSDGQPIRIVSLASHGFSNQNRLEAFLEVPAGVTNVDLTYELQR